MGHIYKITNTINNRCQIGQTIKSCQKRFNQHKNNNNKPQFSQLVLYKAFNKYGIENFTFEEIEEVPNDKLDEREIYWIKYYDSYNNGYNSTLGGKTIQLYEWDIDEVIEKYQELKSARAVAKFYNCDHSTIDNILNTNNVKRFSAADRLSKTIQIEKEGQVIKFLNTNEAAQWFIDNKITQVQNMPQIRAELTRRVKEKRRQFGYKIYYEE